MNKIFGAFLYLLMAFCLVIILGAAYLLFFAEPTFDEFNKTETMHELIDLDFRLDDKRGAYVNVVGSMFKEGYKQPSQEESYEIISDALDYTSYSLFNDKLAESYRWSGYNLRIYLRDLNSREEFSPTLYLGYPGQNDLNGVQIEYKGDKQSIHHNGFTYEIYKNTDGFLTLYYYKDPDWFTKIEVADEFTCKTKYAVEYAKKDLEFDLVDCYNSLEKAKRRLNSLFNSKLKTPVIRRYDNEIIDMKAGIVNFGSVPTNEIINMYDNVDIKNARTYTNGQFGYESGFIQSEIEEFGRVKIKISGLETWVNYQFGENTLELIPSTQIKDHFEDMTHYTVYKNDGVNELAHSFTSNGNFLNELSSIKIGLAPTFMKEDQKYYSFDGNYFYANYFLMLNDLSNGHNRNSLNKDPYFNYYQYLPIRSESNFSGGDLDKYLEYKGLESESVFEGKGNYFILAEQNTGVNAGIEYAWAVHESGFGRSRIAHDKNNLFGMGAYDGNPYEGSLAFDTIFDGVEYHSKRYVSMGYSDVLTDYRYYGTHLGNKASGLNVMYASDPYWGEKIAAHYFRIDSLNDFTEYNKYQIVIKEDSKAVDLFYEIDGNIAYQAKNNELDINIINLPFIVYETVSGYYKVHSEMPIRLSEKEVCLYKKFNTKTGLYDVYDITDQAEVGKVSYACQYNLDENYLYLEATDKIINIVEK